MSGLVIDEARCVGCGRCVRACASGGIVVEGRLARPTDACVLCGACVDACPVDAISIERATAADAVDVTAYHDVWVVASTALGAMDAAAPVALDQVTFELLGRARALAQARACRVVAVLGCGADADAAERAARELIAAGADEVLLCCDDRLGVLDAGVHAAWLADLARARRPEIILMGATAFGRELAPMVAVRLRTGLTADCTVLEIDVETGLLQQTRPAFGGNLMATIVCPAHRPQMATVRPGVFAPAPRDERRWGVVTRVALDPSVTTRRRVLAFEPTDAAGSIASAERLVVVGRGIGSKKNLPLMRRFAELIGAGLGCTRPLVEAGWLTYPHQVGQTGVAVAPKLLVSVGVSGAIQHVAGMGGAETVVAINEDAQAPIFGVSTYAVVGDAIEVVGELVRKLEARS